MRWRTVADNWEAFQESILEAWPDLTEEDLIEIEGDRVAFEKRLVDLTGDDQDDIAQQVEEWMEGAVPSDVHMDEHHDDDSIRDSRLYVSPGEDASDDDRKFGDDNVTDDPVSGG
ncbi:CsbD family protein [Falsirhodobacter algicola]|uniref:CsbD family protein n=1 Tax=Falsirhodobacter algicola TaxID=2692330 RepID=A0A8J8MS82_9RHOB|nr:hypothetical protein [Falsirhodobacter algicola]QUS35464.1 hypothetical protein GR316_03780 [Falsirhodobacter algicola]